MPDLKLQAPNMLIDYPSSSNTNYEMMMVNWKCDIDANNTYWAVSQFNEYDYCIGYAGFQNLVGSHIVILALWNNNSQYPEVEYISPYGRINNLIFGEEGNGKHVLTDYPWQINTWYTMCIGIKNISGKTYYAQWVSEKDSNEWMLCAIISYPQTSKFPNKISAFQEDFSPNNLNRKCSIQDAYGKLSSTHQWQSWNNGYVIKNSFYRYVENPPSPEYNVKFDCGYNIDQYYITVEAGGASLNPPIPISITLPSNPIQITASLTPACTPNWPDLFVPRVIINRNSELYMAPGNNNTVVQSANEYYWHFIDSNDGYYYILTSDHSKALTISDTSSGSDIILSSFNNLDTQKWQKSSAGHSQYSNIVPKNAVDKDIYVPFSSMTAGTQIKLGNKSSFYNHHWFCINTGNFYKIKSYYSSQYINYYNNIVYQRPRQLIWNFVDAGNGYFYILTPDNCKALTFTNDTDGTNLYLASFLPTDTKQMWKLQTISSTNNLHYIISKYNENKNIDIEGPSMQEFAYIQIWTHSYGVNSFKWYLE